MPQRIDVKEYSTFGGPSNALAQYNSSLGVVRNRGVALSACSLSYGGSSHNIKNITVQSGVPFNFGDNKFSFPVQASMNDNSGNQAVSAATFAVPVGFADSGSENTTLKFSVGMIQPNSPANPSFGNTTLNQAYGVLGGFSVAYTSGDQQVLSLGAGINVSTTNLNLPSTTVSVSGSTTINEGASNEASGPVQYLAIGQVAGDPTQFIPMSWTTGAGQVSIPLNNLPNPINQAAVFIRSFSLSYNSADDVRTILLDAGNNSLSITNVLGRKKAPGSATITFTPQLIMTDGSKNATGTLELLVMAVPAPAA